MLTLKSVENKSVQEIYSGAVGQLWEFVMGEQIHIGGFPSSMELFQKAKIQPGEHGVDLCCCSGAGMRFLLKIGKVGHMTGVDFTPAQIALGQQRMADCGLSEKTEFVLSSATKTPLADNSFDFVWGEDAWVYVDDKPALIREAARLVKVGGTVAFTDWCEGEVPMTQEESDRFLNFMQFATVASRKDYVNMLQSSGLTVKEAVETDRFVPCVDLYIQMLTTQHTFDALRILNYDEKMFAALGEEMFFTQRLAKEKKLVQCRFIAQK